MTLNSYFTLNSGLRVVMKYLARCLLTDLLLPGSRGQSLPNIFIDTVSQSPCSKCV